MNTRKCRLLLTATTVLCLLALNTGVLLSQTEDSPGDSGLKKLSDKYAPVFRSLEAWLETAPPPGKQQKTREKNLKKIDRAMLEDDAKKFECVGAFFQSRMNTFIRDFSSADPGDDTFIWKLYNHTEIIQTKDITIAVDLLKGFNNVELSDEILAEIISRTDVLLVSHEHGDHVQPAVVDMFLDAGRPVVVPYLFWPDYPRNDQLTVIRKGDLYYPGSRIVVFPSMQKNTLNNVYLIITDNGHSVMHIGDNNNFFQSGHEWFRKFRKPVQVDVLIPNIWTPDMASLLKYIRPALILSSHEHELGHPPSGRRTYEYVYNVLRTIKEPYVVPMWGEKVVLEKK